VNADESPSAANSSPRGLVSNAVSSLGLFASEAAFLNLVLPGIASRLRGDNENRATSESPVEGETVASFSIAVGCKDFLLNKEFDNKNDLRGMLTDKFRCFLNGANLLGIGSEFISRSDSEEITESDWDSGAPSDEASGDNCGDGSKVEGSSDDSAVELDWRRFHENNL
jgi:hypothetical protein